MDASKLTTGRPTPSSDLAHTGAATDALPRGDAPPGSPGGTPATPSASTTPATVPSGPLQGLAPRAKRALFGREVAFNALVPGVGGTVERPVRASLPPPHTAAPQDEASRLDGLTAQAQGLRDRLPVRTPVPWDRGARTTGNQVATTLVPWMKPRPLTEKATTHDGPARPQDATPVPATDSALAQALQHRLSAEIVVDMAHQQLAAAQAATASATAAASASSDPANGSTTRPNAPTAAATPPTRQALAAARASAAKAVSDAVAQEGGAQHAVQAAQQRLAEATRVQQAQAGSGGLQPLAAEVQAHQQLADKDRFVRQRLADTKEALYGARSAAVDQVRQLADAERQLAAATQHAQTTEIAQQAALEHHETLQTAVDRAQAQLRAAQAGTETVTPDALPRLLRLKSQLQESNAQLQSATRSHDAARLNAASAAEQVAALRPEAATARQQLETTGPGVSAVLQASLALAASADQVPDPAIAKAAFDAREAQALQIQAKRPRGFAGGIDSERFGARLLDAVQRRPANPSADALPSIGVMEIASDLMSVVSQGDPARAHRLLEALQSRPARDWMQDVADLPAHGAGAESADAADADADVHNLLRQASVLPRGAEVVHLLGHPSGSMPDSETLQAMRAFWSADAAQRAEPDAAVRHWLAGAKRVARQLPADAVDASSVATVSSVDRAAYHAVRNGCVSNAEGSPFARHDDRMKKAITEWVVREQPSASWLKRAMTPHRHKTPFTSGGLQRATAIAESFGMTTHRSQADSGVRKTAGALADWARSGLAQDLTAAGVAAPDARAFAAATQALAERAAQQGHPSQWTLKGSEGSALRAATHALEHPPSTEGRRRLHKPDRHHTLPPLFEELAADGADATQALRAVIDHLKLTLADAAPAERHEVLTHDVATHAAADMARQQRFRSKEDVVRYFEPILLSMQLRDKVKLSGGGIVGGGLPSLPYSVPSPVVSPVLSAGWSRKEEAFFQAFMPILGMEISLGSARTSGPEATVGVAAGPDLPGVVKAQVSATEKMSRQHQQTEGTILRLFRQRGKDDELRQEMLGVLDSWVRWDQVHPAGGTPYAGPLEAVLDRHPKVSLGEIQGDSLTRSFVSRVSAGANLKLSGGDGSTYRVGVSAGAALKAERIAESRTEHGGHIRVTADKGDTAQQKVSVGVQINTLTPANPSEVKLGPEGRHGAIAGGGMPGLIDANRDVFWNLEKHAVSPFTIGGKQDADLDRHYSTPAEMLTSIERHRDDWIARGVETLAPDATGEKNTPENREKAAALLHDFEAQVRQLGQDSRLCQYNVNFSMRPQAAAWIDTFRALEGLATLRDDAQGAAEARANADRTMQQDSTWRPLMLIVREKGREQRTLGWNFGVRLQRSIGVEGQRTAAQYPPP
ncbi:hypothetical protein [Roseateles amylovorans]|uniref:Type III effector protein n=1 Tax=Roseateles amylovorans TaxID=2978473 RepID=A0ABY6B1B9_9BURK|nr:hypothetical protein [Roseateles amylovorans]UXH78645.1 hypothetical protein N4261_01505 [Roseateles amylovorans]